MQNQTHSVGQMTIMIKFTAAQFRDHFNGQDLVKIAALMSESTLFPAFPQVFPQVGRAEDGCAPKNVLGFSPTSQLCKVKPFLLSFRRDEPPRGGPSGESDVSCHDHR